MGYSCRCRVWHGYAPTLPLVRRIRADDEIPCALRLTGQATVELTPFKHIIGVDPSARMIERAREGVKTSLAGLDLSSQIKFEQSSAEELNVLQDGSVDLVVAGTSYDCAASSNDLVLNSGP